MIDFKLKKPLTSIAIFLFLLSGCQEDKKIETEPQKSSTQNCFLPYNNSNPHDWIGADHNSIVDETIDTYPYEVTDYENIADHTYEVSKNYYDTTLNDDYFPMPKNDVDPIIEDTSNFYDNYISNTDLSSEAVNYLLNLFNGLENYICAEYCDIKSYIEAEEDYLLDNQNHNIPSNEVDLLLAMTSIGRHSIYYWVSEYGDELGGEECEGQITALFLNISLGTVLLGGADLLGGYAGYKGGNEEDHWSVRARDVVVGAATTTAAYAGVRALF